MSGSNVLEKYVSRTPEPVKKPAEEPGAVDDVGAFGLLRGIHERALMLELRMKDGNAVAFNYSYLQQASFDPSEGITLHFGGKSIKIEGTNLGVEVRTNLKLFQALIRHRVAWIQECDAQTALSAPAGALVIDNIEMDG
ncbi:MAG: hypothetical protein KF861_01395 [Planctomycetaceae bacterium]|nr:hypothetical protein [Planctomycetaceae bacterium]